LQPETLWSPWKLQDQELLAGKQDALRLSLDEQIRAGIDIVSDGEQTRQHFVTTFIEHLSGVDFENRQTVRIRNRYDASVPTVVSPLRVRNRYSSTMQVPAPAHGQADQMGPARADDHDRHPVRRAL
jgi:methionine synthase II (cobalamin-independent)